MDTEILRSGETALKRAKEILENGGLVVFPTETVYGLGALLSCEEATKKIYQIKERDAKKPLSILISDIRQLGTLINVSKDYAAPIKRITDKFWPGPLTLILPKSDLVPDTVTAGKDTVGIRMPSDFFALDLISLSDAPLVTTSANLSGMPPATSFEEAVAALSGKVGLIIDGGECRFKKASTVVELKGFDFDILREGMISSEKLQSVLRPADN